MNLNPFHWIRTIARWKRSHDHLMELQDLAGQDANDLYALIYTMMEPTSVAVTTTTDVVQSYGEGMAADLLHRYFRAITVDPMNRNGHESLEVFLARHKPERFLATYTPRWIDTGLVSSVSIDATVAKVVDDNFWNML